MRDVKGALHKMHTELVQHAKANFIPREAHENGENTAVIPREAHENGENTAVIPAEAGIQTSMLNILDSRFRGNDGVSTVPVKYALKFNEHVVNLNDRIGQEFAMTFTGNIFCIQCARKTNKSFQQGYCFPCLRKLQECNLCMIHPERCNVESGTCPENDWAHSHCNQPHIIYLANASGLKIGITRETNVPTRWLDQGAIQALPLFRVSQRALAGKIEVIFKKYVADKTNWQAMLKNAVMPLDLIAERDRLLKLAETELNLIKSQYQEQVEFLNSATPLDINYPVLSFPQKIISLSFDKTPTVAGKLVGIKGQYLIFDKGVINIRKFGGFEVSLA